MEENNNFKGFDVKTSDSVPQKATKTTPQAPTKSDVVPRLRTFSSDIQTAVTSRNLSKAKIVTSEQTRARKEGREPEVKAQEKPHLGLVLGYVLVIGLFIAGGFGLFLFIQTQMQASKVAQINNVMDGSIISASLVHPVGINEADAIPQFTQKFHREVNAIRENSSVGSFVEIKPFLISLDEEGKRDDQPLSLDSLLYRQSASDQGFGRLATEYMYGVHSGKNTFILARVSDPDEAYGRIFEWENRIIKDLQPMFPTLTLDQKDIEIPAEEESAEIGSEEEVISEDIDTETQTVNESPEIPDEGGDENAPENEEDVVEKDVPSEKITIFDPNLAKFQDEIFFNFDSRVVRDNEGNVRFLYTFIQPTLVLITIDPSVISAVNTELKNRTIRR